MHAIFLQNFLRFGCALNVSWEIKCQGLFVTNFRLVYWSLASIRQLCLMASELEGTAFYNCFPFFFIIDIYLHSLPTSTTDTESFTIDICRFINQKLFTIYRSTFAISMSLFHPLNNNLSLSADILPHESCAERLCHLGTLKLSNNQLSGKEPTYIPKFILYLTAWVFIEPRIISVVINSTLLRISSI